MKTAEVVLSIVLMLGASRWLPAQSSGPLSQADSASDARKPFQFHFPRDLYDHPDYQTEWWYFTGNLHSKNGGQYGFELTFFRSYEPAGAPAGQPQYTPIIFADLAVSNL